MKCPGRSSATVGNTQAEGGGGEAAAQLQGPALQVALSYVISYNPHNNPMKQMLFPEKEREAWRV